MKKQSILRKDMEKKWSFLNVFEERYGRNGAL